MHSAQNIFWIGVGDIHEHIAPLRRIPSLEEAQGVLMAGDMTTMGGRKEALPVLTEMEKYNSRIYAQIGNMDTREVNDLFTEKGINVHGKAVDLGHGVGLIGLGYSSPTPFHTPSEASEAQLERWLGEAHKEAEAFRHLILMTHTPPHGTSTDRLSSGLPAGSLAVRRFIEAVQPAVCLTGHIHEAKSEDRIGKTRIVNPGMFQEGGYAVIRLEEDSLSISLEQVAN